MGLSLNGVHRFSKSVDATGKPITILAGQRPYIRLMAAGEVSIYIQGARAYGAGGHEIALAELPKWFLDKAPMVAPKVQRETGLDQLLKNYAERMLLVAEEKVRTEAAPQVTQPELVPKAETKRVQKKAEETAQKVIEDARKTVKQETQPKPETPRGVDTVAGALSIDI